MTHTQEPRSVERLAVVLFVPTRWVAKAPASFSYGGALWQQFTNGSHWIKWKRFCM